MEFNQRFLLLKIRLFVFAVSIEIRNMKPATFTRVKMVHLYAIRLIDFKIIDVYLLLYSAVDGNRFQGLHFVLTTL